MIFRNLEDVRREMAAEIKQDYEKGAIYLSNRLNKHGREVFLSLLVISAEDTDCLWLAGNLSLLMNETEERSHPLKGIITAKVPSNAGETLATAEFNRYYMRGLCVKAIVENKKVLVYRAKESSRPRPEHEKLVDVALEPGSLLQELRSASSELTTPGCGLSIQLL